MKTLTKIVPGADLKNTEDQLNRIVQPGDRKVINAKNQITSQIFCTSYPITVHQLENLESDSCDSDYYLYPVIITEHSCVHQVKHHSLLQ